MGIAPNSNYLIKLEPDRTDVWPPEYSLFYYIPKVVVPALQPFHVEAKFHAKHPVDHFVVTDATGWHAVEVKQDLAFAEPLTDEFIIIARGATTPPPSDCQVIQADNLFVQTHDKAFGPASETECEKWGAENCSPGG